MDDKISEFDAMAAAHLRNAGGNENRGPRVVRLNPARQSRFFSASMLQDKPVPEREWLVPDLVPGNTVTLLGGDGGTGKSLLALQLAVAVTAGTAWIGRAINHGGAIYLSAEDDEHELHRRIDSILRGSGRGYSDVTGLTLRSLAGEDALLAIDSQIALTRSALFDELESRAVDESPALIVIDTLADVYPANENDRAKVRQFVGMLRGLALRTRCAVVLLAHPSLSGLTSGSGSSGSTAWSNSVRSRLYLSRITDEGFEPDPDARVLTTKKSNYGRTGGEITLTWRSGVFVAPDPESGLDARASDAKAERVFLKLLAEFNAEGRRVRHTTGDGYAPHAFAKSGRAEGVSRNDLRHAMEKLFASGRIRVVEDGPKSRRIRYLEEVRK